MHGSMRTGPFYTGGKQYCAGLLAIAPDLDAQVAAVLGLEHLAAHRCRRLQPVERALLLGVGQLEDAVDDAPAGDGLRALDLAVDDRLLVECVAHQPLVVRVPNLDRRRFVSVTGFGPDGPYSDQPVYDLVVQGMCGAMPHQGDDGPPQMVRSVIADKGLQPGITLSKIELAAIEAPIHLPMPSQDVQVTQVRWVHSYPGR